MFGDRQKILRPTLCNQMLPIQSKTPLFLIKVLSIEQPDSSSQRRGIASGSRIDLPESNKFLELNRSVISMATARQNVVQGNVCDRATSRTEFPIGVTRKPDIVELENSVVDICQRTEQLEKFSLLQSPMGLDDNDQRIEASSAQEDIKCSSKQIAVRELDEEYGIDYDILCQHSDKKLQDVAQILGVSRSTLKRICRKYDILRWPPRKKAKKSKRTLQASIQATEGNVEDQRMKSNLQYLKKSSSHNTRALQEGLSVHDGSRMMVKVIYEDDIIIKFELLESSTKLDLEEKVATRLKLSVGSFSVKYLDEENEWVLVTCDEDLRTCMRSSRSLGKATIRMVISYN